FKQAIRCIVNVQHNCATSQCTISKTRITRQEREGVEHRADEVNHANTDKWLLNTCQMRSSR
ncbi:hypothetical protein FA15DRAFT_550466, partial [Coprinopsis marcescibilis]